MPVGFILMTLDANLIGEHLPLPKQGSWPKAIHVFEKDDVYALMAAEAAERPLLIRGEPGTGKSQLARAAAVATGRLFLSVVVNARTECQDLQWQFDAVARLGEAQALAHCPAEEIPARMHPRRFLTPGPLWWVFDWSSAVDQFQKCTHPLEKAPQPPEGWQPQQGSVLLIDEIDKADTDLPNGLLETLGNGDFTVPYLGQSVRQSPDCPRLPLVIITTNEERELPAAFLRRCLVRQLRLPETDAELLKLLCARGEVHVGTRCTAAVRQKAGELLLEDRKTASCQGLPAPGQAEYLDLLRAVCELTPDEAEQQRLLDQIGEFVLKKAPA